MKNLSVTYRTPAGIMIILSIMTTAGVLFLPSVAAAPKHDTPQKQEVCASLQTEIQEILLHAVRARNNQRNSPVLMDETSQTQDHGQLLDDVERRAHAAGCLENHKAEPGSS